MNIVLAAHTREVKTALYLALNAAADVTVVATAASTGELVTYCHAFLPDVAIVESGLPGRPLGEVLSDFERSAAPRRILVVGENDASNLANEFGRAELLRDTDHLTAILPDLEMENGTR